MLYSRSIVPAHGNPFRSIFLLLTVFFTAMLIGFPILMRGSGVRMGETIGVTLLIIVVAAVCLGIILWMADSVEWDRFRLQTTDAWAAWQLAEEEYRKFVRAERLRSIGWASAFMAGGLAMGAFFLTTGDDRMTGVIMIVVFLLAGAVMLMLGGPPWRASANARDVIIGARGVQVLGRYMPLEMTATHLRFVELRPEDDPTVIVFTVRSGNKTQEIRVPIAHGRWEEAEALVERFRLGPTESGY